MSTGFENIDIDKLHISFESIENHVKAFEAAAYLSQEFAPGKGDKFQRLSTVYTAARPILIGVAATSLVPPNWRGAVHIFIAALDEVTASFKAGKDLATTEMEPKLPVG